MVQGCPNNKIQAYLVIQIVFTIFKVNFQIVSGDMSPETTHAWQSIKTLKNYT